MNKILHKYISISQLLFNQFEQNLKYILIMIKLTFLLLILPFVAINFQIQAFVYLINS